MYGHTCDVRHSLFIINLREFLFNVVEHDHPGRLLVKRDLLNSLKVDFGQNVDFFVSFLTSWPK